MMRRVLYLVLGSIIAYLIVAYVGLPWAWTVRTRHHPDLSAGPASRTRPKASLGIP
jgi:hypothetical protein